MVKFGEMRRWQWSKRNKEFCIFVFTPAWKIEGASSFFNTLMSADP